MAAWLAKMFGVSLILTIIMEWAAAVCLGIRTHNKLLLVALVNVLTNPPAVMLHWLGNIYMSKIPDLCLQLGIEIMVVITETLVYKSFHHTKKVQWHIERPIRLALITNVCSWSAGMLFMMLRNC